MVDRMKSGASVKGAIWYDESNAQQFEFFPVSIFRRESERQGERSGEMEKEGRGREKRKEKEIKCWRFIPSIFLARSSEIHCQKGY